VHVQAFDFVAAHVGRLAPASVLEIGSLDINGSVRALFGAGVDYHGLDVVDGPGVDEVGDAATWRASRGYELVVSTEVLEHAPRWRDILTNAWDAVAPGGRLLATCATDPRAPHSAVDGLDVRPEEHYANVAPRDVLARTRSWETERLVLETHQGRGDLYLRADRIS
jgi:hypothetical protein